jgi:hypothetical protein
LVEAVLGGLRRVSEGDQSADGFGVCGLDVHTGAHNFNEVHFQPFFLSRLDLGVDFWIGAVVFDVGLIKAILKAEQVLGGFPRGT